MCDLVQRPGVWATLGNVIFCYKMVSFCGEYMRKVGKGEISGNWLELDLSNAQYYLLLYLTLISV